LYIPDKTVHVSALNAAERDLADMERTFKASMERELLAVHCHSSQISNVWAATTPGPIEQQQLFQQELERDKREHEKLLRVGVQLKQQHQHSEVKDL
jgi:hypothetical protein